MSKGHINNSMFKDKYQTDMNEDKLSVRDKKDVVIKILYENGLNPMDYIDLIKDIESFAKDQLERACKEQREICAKVYYTESCNLNGTWWQGLKDLIRNAPPPK